MSGRSNIFPEDALADGHEFQMFSFEDTTSCKACQMLLRLDPQNHVPHNPGEATEGVGGGFGGLWERGGEVWVGRALGGGEVMEGVKPGVGQDGGW